MLDFFCFGESIDLLSAFKMLRHYEKHSFPVTILCWKRLAFAPRYGAPVTTFNVHHSLVEQIAVFVCTYFPAFILQVEDPHHFETQSTISLCIYYVQFWTQPLLPDICGVSDPIRIEAFCHYLCLNTLSCVYMSETISSRIFFDELEFEAPVRHHHTFPLTTAIDKKARSDLIWTHYWRLIFLAIHRPSHLLNKKDIIREIGTFLFLF